MLLPPAGAHKRRHQVYITDPKKMIVGIKAARMKLQDVFCVSTMCPSLNYLITFHLGKQQHHHCVRLQLMIVV